ncbi:MAG: hypothetical protein P9M03_05335 [Candidatus Theseobacter exili]|nr:hypothetical protein [Candidatus Theseobacter exili]
MKIYNDKKTILKWHGSLLILSLLFSLILSFSAQYPLIMDKYYYQNDMSTHTWWMYTFQDPELFQNDYLMELTKKHATIGYKNLHYFASFFTDPITFTKLIPILLSLITTFYLFLIGKHFKGEITGLIISIIYLLSNYSYQLSNGLQRSFKEPLLIIFFYYFIKKKYIKAATISALTLLFYPPAFLICSASYFISLIDFKKINPFRYLSRNQIIGGLLIVTSAASFFLASYNKKDSSNLTLHKRYSWEEMKELPEFSRKGALALFLNKKNKKKYPFNPFGLSRRLMIGFYNYQLPSIYISLMLLFILGFPALKLQKEVYCLLAAGLILYIIAFHFFSLLYLPSRYQNSVISLFLLMFIGINLGKAYEKIIDDFRKKKILTLCIKCIPFFLCLIAFLFSYKLNFIKPKGYKKVAHRNFYKFLSTLPKDSLIAGPPSIMNETPLFSKRSAYTTEKFQDKDPEIKRRTFLFFKAYYASNFEEIKKFAKKEKVDYIVVQKDHFKNKRYTKRNYYSPYYELIKGITSNRKDFAILRPNPEDIIFESDKLTVFKCDWD